MKANLSSKKHVVVVGAGFGGLRAAQNLAAAGLRVTLVDRNNYHLFQPLLYQVATAGLSPDEIAYPLRAILRRQRNITFYLAEVNRVNLAERRLETSTGVLNYDFLVLAVGGVTHFYGNATVQANGIGLKTLEDASSIRNRLLRIFERAALEQNKERRRALLTFVVVGGGPTGVESAGAISELIRLVLVKEYPSIDFNEARVLLLEAGERLLPAMPPALSAAAHDALRRKHVEVRLKTAVAAYDGHKVVLQNDDSMAAETLIWAAGIQASPLVAGLGAKVGSQGRVKVEPTLQLPGHPEVFVIGDAAYQEDEAGNPLPMVAPVAMQQGIAAASNILSLLAGRPLAAFRYCDPGMLATIGRSQAVASLGRFQFRGFLAWLLWLGVHIFQLIGFRNRLLVMIDWAWQYIFFDRAVRLITAEPCQDLNESAYPEDRLGATKAESLSSPSKAVSPTPCEKRLRRTQEAVQ